MRQCLVSSILALIVSIHLHSYVNLTVTLAVIAILCALILSVRYSVAHKIVARILLLISFLLSLVYVNYWLDERLSSRLPMQLSSVVISGTARVVNCDNSTFGVEKLRLKLLSLDSTNPQLQQLKQITLNHYLQRRKYGADPLEAGLAEQKEIIGCHKILKFTAKLRAPYSFINPYGFDYEAWQLSRGIDASGYVLSYEILSVDDSFQAQLVEFRQEGIRRAASLPGKAGEIVPALLFGDSGYLNKDTWLDFQMTGTVHLLIVSGLHIGFLIVLVMLIWRQFIRLEVFVFARSQSLLLRLTPIVLLAACLLYCYMAGMGVAVQRSGLMLAMAIVVSFSRYHWSLFDSWLWVMWMVLVINPMVSLFVGFWFSFMAVGSLLLTHAGIIRTFKNSLLGGRIAIVYRPQWIVFLALLPLLWFFQQPASLFSLLVNMLAIPLLAFVILPLSLISFLVPDPLLLSLFNTFLDYLLVSLHQLSQQTSWLVYKASGFWIYAVIPLLGFALMFKGFPFKHTSLVVLASIFFLPIHATENKLLVLDVGQGLSVYGQSQVALDHAVLADKGMTNWLYDTGAKFRSGFSLGDAVAAKNILALSGEQLDLLFISHSDNDHAGGEEGLLRKIQVSNTFAGQPTKAQHQPCHTLNSDWRAGNGMKWRVLNVVGVDQAESSDNDSSCIVQFDIAGRRILITGDAERKIEKLLIDQFGQQLRSDILLIGHHGSKTSSSEEFIQTVNPKIAILSSGFNNAFKHPHASVIERFRRMSIPLYNTATSGAIEVELAEKPTVIEWRKRNPPIWRQL